LGMKFVADSAGDIVGATLVVAPACGEPATTRATTRVAPTDHRG
jgi:hypothetical protein